MKNKYYCFIAGLPDLLPDLKKMPVSMEELKTEIKANIHPDDYSFLALYFLRYDNINVLNLLQEKQEPVNNLGNYSTEELETVIAEIKTDGADNIQTSLPDYLINFIGDYFEEKLNTDPPHLENSLAKRYYDYALETENPFIQHYINFELGLQNIRTAIQCRKYDFSFEDAIIGNNELAQVLKKSSAKDFGITTEFEFAEKVIQIAEIPEILERERKIDALRWDHLDDQIFFFYFTIERIFAFLIKLEILERWSSMDKEKGLEKFNQALKELKESYHFPEEFEIK